MASGGARNRSGPQKDPNSGRSDRAGVSYTALPSEGFQGEAPDLKDFLPRPTARERAIWDELWRTPQAAAWARESWRWPVVADLTKYLRRADAKDSPVGLATAIRQLRDDLGLSTAGLKQHGWSITTDELEPRREPDAAAPESGRRERRLRPAGAQP